MSELITRPSLYLIGSLRNPEVPKVAEQIRKLGYDVFDDWYAAGPEADDYWRDYEKARGHTYEQALAGYAAGHVFEFDKTHLDRCDMCVLLYPAGRSGHIEFGYARGAGKHAVICIPEEPERYDVMLKFAHKICLSVPKLLEYLDTFKISKPKNRKR